MTEAVGVCALAVVAYLATRPRPGTPLWTLPPITYPPAPGSIRRHDGTGRMWDDGCFVVPPILPDVEHAWQPAQPDDTPGQLMPGEADTPPPIDAVALRLDFMEARLHAWLDAEYVSVCMRMQIEPVAVTRTAKRKQQHVKGKSHGTTQQARVPAEDRPGTAHPHRGRRRVRGGMRVA